MHVVALLTVLLLVLLPTQANYLEIHYFADTDDTCSSQPTTFEYASVGTCQYGYKVAGSSTGDGVVRYVYSTVDSTTVRVTSHAAGDTACTLPTLTVDVKLSTCTVDPSGTYVSYVSVSQSSSVATPAFEYGAGSVTTYPLCFDTNANQAITTRTVSNPERCSISEDDGRPTRQLCNATHIFTLKYNRTYLATECQGAGYLTGLTNMVDKTCTSGPDSVFSCLPVRSTNPTPAPDPIIPSNTWVMTERIYQDVASSAGGSATLSNGVTAFAFINTFVLVSGYATDGSRAFHISPSNAGFGSSVSVASLSDINGFVVVWLSNDNSTIQGRIYNNDGTARTDILTIFSAPASSYVANPYVTSLGPSRFGVVFSAGSTTSNSDWIYGAVHDYLGLALSRSIVCQSNTTYSCAGGQPSISSFGTTGLALAWLHFNPATPTDISISGCLYNFDMLKLNNIFPLSASEVATRRQLSLVYLSGDNIAAAWSRAVISPVASITPYEVIGCVFNPVTDPMGCYNGNLRLHAVTTRDQVRPRISAVNPSEYLAVWVDTNFGVQGTIASQNALPYTQGLLLKGSSMQMPFPATLTASTNENQAAFQLSFLSDGKIHTRFATYYKIGTNDRKKNDHGFFSFHNRIFIAILVGAGPLIIGLIVVFFVVLFRKKDDDEITNTNDPSFKALSNKSQSSWDSKSSTPSSPSSYSTPAAVITSSPSSNNNFTTSYSSTSNTETKSETSTPFTSSYNDGKSSTMKKPKRDTVDEEIAKLASFEMPLIMQRSATPVSETKDSKAIELDTFSTPKKAESVDSRNSSFEEPPPAYSATPPDAAAPAELSAIEPEITSDSPPSFSSLNQTIDDIFNTPSKPSEENNNDSASKTEEIDAMADVDSTIAQMNDIVNQMNNMQNWLAN